MTPTADLMTRSEAAEIIADILECTPTLRERDESALRVALAALTASCDARVGGEGEHEREIVLALLADLARSLPPISIDQTATQHMIQKNRRESSLQRIGDFILGKTATPAQPKVSCVCPNTLALCECDKFSPCAKQAQPKASEAVACAWPSCDCTNGRAECPKQTATNPKASEGKAGGEDVK